MKKVLPLFYRLTNIKPIRSYKIKDGITNINYKVTTNEGDFVIRIPRKDIIGLNRVNEEKVINLIKKENLNVDVVYFDATSGVMISKYLKIKKRKQVDFDEVITHLNKLHSLDITNIDEFNPFSLLETFKKHSEEIHFVKSDKVIKNTKELYQRYNKVLCHNDILYANCLKTNDNIYLIDYEYAGVNIELFDIVSFLSENDIDDYSLQLKFIKKYFKEVNDQLLNDINTMFLFSDMLWAYWGYAMYNLYKEDVFLQIAISKNKRYHLKAYTY